MYLVITRCGVRTRFSETNSASWEATVISSTVEMFTERDKAIARGKELATENEATELFCYDTDDDCEELDTNYVKADGTPNFNLWTRNSLQLDWGCVAAWEATHPCQNIWIRIIEADDVK